MRLTAFGRWRANHMSRRDMADAIAGLDDIVRAHGSDLRAERVARQWERDNPGHDYEAERSVSTSSTTRANVAGERLTAFVQSVAPAYDNDLIRCVIECDAPLDQAEAHRIGVAARRHGFDAFVVGPALHASFPPDEPFAWPHPIQSEGRNSRRDSYGILAGFRRWRVAGSATIIIHEVLGKPNGWAVISSNENGCTLTWRGRTRREAIRLALDWEATANG